VLRDEGNTWNVDKNGSPIGFGKPNFGPYTTLDAGKQDTAVMRTKNYLGKESSLGTDGGIFFFDQFKNYEFSKTKFCFLRLGTAQDTVEATYAVIVQGIESRRSFLSTLLNNGNENGSSGSGYARRDIKGIFRTDSLNWSFAIDDFNGEGMISGGHLSNDLVNFRLVSKVYQGHHWEIITQNDAGEYLASLEFRLSGTELRMLKKLDQSSADAIAVLYAVLLSARNVQ
jgi:hypothetical protein